MIDFLEKYEHPVFPDGKMDPRMQFIVPYIKRRNIEKELLSWDIAFVGNIKPIGKNSQIDWLNFKKFNMVSRTRREKSGHIENGKYNLGSVSTSSDRRMMLKKEDDILIKPLLLIYRINKNSEPEKKSTTRKALFENLKDKVDVLAFSIVFPKTKNTVDKRNYIQQIIEK